MYKRIFTFLEKYEILYSYQFGFRKGYSTKLALVDILEKIHMAMDSGNFVWGVYIDLKKAFDTVNHKILLEKLSHYRIRGVALHWFDSYLSDRKQHVQLESVKSQETVVNIGVPQGSVLGPLLFLLCINDIVWLTIILTVISCYLLMILIFFNLVKI